MCLISAALTQRTSPQILDLPSLSCGTSGTCVNPSQLPFFSFGFVCMDLMPVLTGLGCGEIM